MRFRGRRPAPNPWWPVGLVLVVLSVPLGLHFWREYVREYQEEAQETKVVARIKKPVRKKISTSLESGGKREKRRGPQIKKEGTEKGDTKRGKGNFYRVRKGDTLYNISSRKDVYGDPAKWPSLFRMNRALLSDMEVTEDFPHRVLRPGLDLRFVMAREAQGNASKLGPKAWVVNVLSAHSSQRVVQPAILLMKKGYHAYIDRAKVKGKEWVRLRVGFYKDRQGAESVAKKIGLILKVKGLWVTTAKKEELLRFGGY